MSDDQEAYSDLLNRLEEQKVAIEENLREAYTNYSNNPVAENNSQDEYNTKEAKFARAIEYLVVEDYDPLILDDSKNFLEFVATLRKEISETEKYVAYKKAKIEKLKTDIQFLKTNTSRLQEAMSDHESRTSTPKEVSRERQIEKVKISFRKMKKEMNYVLKALYPNYYSQISDFMVDICNSHFAEDGSEYTEISSDVNVAVLELLITSKLISAHPHQERMFKLVV